MIDFDLTGTTEKQKNIFMMLDHLTEHEVCSALDIVEATGLSLATVSRGINTLKNVAVVKERGKERTDMGRHPAILGLNPDYGHFLHFYMNNDILWVYMVDFCGNVSGNIKTSIDQNIQPTLFCQKMYGCAKELALRLGIDYEHILAASIAVPGLVDWQAAVLRRIPNYINFKNINLFEYAEDALNVPVIINNEARLSVMGGYIHDFPSKKNLVYIDFTPNSGIGSGIMVDGKLMRGGNGFAGEIGDMPVDIHNFDSETADDEGCLEAQAGVGVLYSKLNALLKRGRAKILGEIMAMEAAQSINLGMVERAVLMRDMDVSDVFDDVIKKWSVAIINICTILDPDMILLGGTVNRKNDVVLARIKHFVSGVLGRDISIELCNTDEYQMYGGIYALKNYAFNNILPKQIFGEE